MKVIDIVIVGIVLALMVLVIYRSFDKKRNSCSQGCDSCGYSCNSFTKEYLEKYKRDKEIASQKANG